MSRVKVEKAKRARPTNGPETFDETVNRLTDGSRCEIMKPPNESKIERVAVEKETPDILREQTKDLRRIFPGVFSEDKIDYEKLQSILGEIVDTRTERFTFAWTGKRNAIQILQMPTRATLVPAKDESVDFGTSSNLFIEGDCLEVMKLLYKAYFGKVKMIYIDPPYNTGNDFVYPDNYADPLDTYLRISGQRDFEGNLLTSNPETSGRYHSAWLSMMYPRLFLARQLLRENGVIFVSIDDKEAHNLRLLMNEIFGEENFVDTIIWKKRYGGGAKEKYLVSIHEYVLFYAKNKDVLEEIFVPGDSESKEKYYRSKDEKFPIRGPYRTHPLEATRSVGVRKNLVYPIPGPDGREVWPKRQWWWERPRTMQALKNNELEFVKGKDGKLTVHTKQYWLDEQGRIRQSKPFSIIDSVYTQHGTSEIEEIFGDSRIFPFPKPTGLLKFLLQIAGVKGDDIVLDPFAGSCTTAQAVVGMNGEDGGNRRFIMIQLPEPLEPDSRAAKPELRTVADVGKERIRRVMARLKKEKKGQLAIAERAEDLGFRVFKLGLSNYKPWKGVDDKTPEAYAAEMEAHVDSLVNGWKKENVIYEVAIKEGLGLTSKIELEKRYKDNEIWRVEDLEKGQSLLICLDNNMKTSTIRSLELAKDDLFVCRDIALDDTGAANLALQCNLKTI